MQCLRNLIYQLLRQSESFFKTDMIYLAKGGGWLITGQVVAAGASFLLSIAFANLASKEVFGNYKFVLSLAGIVGAFSLTGLGTAVVQAVARGFEGTLRNSFWLNLKWSVFSLAAFMAISAYYYVNGNMTLAASLFVAGLFSPILSSVSIYKPFLMGKKDFETDAVYGIWRAIVPALSIMAILAFTNNIFVLVFTYFFSHTASAAAVYFKTLVKYKPNNKVDESVLQFSKHVSIMSFSNTLASKLDSILIFHFLGATEVAIYYFAIALPQQIQSLFRHIGTLAMPKFAEKTLYEIRLGIYKKSVFIVIVLLVAIFSYIFAAPYIYGFFFPQYLESIRFSQVAIFSILAVTSILPGTALNAMKAVKELHKTVIIGATAQIMLLVILVYFYGLWGAIVANILTKIIKVFFTYYYFAKVPSASEKALNK